MPVVINIVNNVIVYMAPLLHARNRNSSKKVWQTQISSMSGAEECYYSTVAIHVEWSVDNESAGVGNQSMMQKLGELER